MQGVWVKEKLIRFKLLSVKPDGMVARGQVKLMSSLKTFFIMRIAQIVCLSMRRLLDKSCGQCLTQSLASVSFLLPLQ